MTTILNTCRKSNIRERLNHYIWLFVINKVVIMTDEIVNKKWIFWRVLRLSLGDTKEVEE